MGQAEIIQFLKVYSDAWFSGKEIAAFLNVSYQTTLRNLYHLKKMKTQTIVEVKEISPNRYMYKIRK